jgi:hypothetical protein
MRVVPSLAESTFATYRRVGLEAEPKTGKTRFATSLPWGEDWGEKAIYVGWDESSRDLNASPILAHNVDRLIGVYPEEGLSVHKEAVAIASRDWKKEYPEAGTMIWDTLTTTGINLLHEYANSGAFSDKQISVGSKATKDYIAEPMMGDYKVAQGAIMEILRQLFKQKLHLIVLFHIEPDGDEGTGAYGPATVGRASIKRVAAMFDNLFRIEAKDKIIQGSSPPRTETKLILHTARKGRWLAGMRSPHLVNPIPELEIPQGNPVEAWVKLTKVMKGEQ